MIEIKHHVALKEHNTFGISAFAKAYTSIITLQQLSEAIAYFQNQPVFLLGGGSNMLLLNDIEKPVLHVNLKGIEKQKNDDGTILLKVMAGENWHDLVIYCVQNNYAGIENLALIPGNTGTAPIQNIGAYGVELKNVFHSCEVMDLETAAVKSFNKDECNFGYRDSIFKNEASGKYVITSVTLRLIDLNQSNDYQLKTNYGAIAEEMDNLSGEASIAKVAQAVINIRTSKLPDPKVIGNSGSFFKNPIISTARFEELLVSYPEMPSYGVDETQVKVPAGWLIDQSGFKGKRYGDAGIHERQALVLVNHGNATGEEILAVAKKIQKAVLEKYGISIETEVNLIDN